MQRVTKTIALMEKVVMLDDPQCELLLLRACTGVSKLYFALRTCPPSTFETAQRTFDGALRSSLERIVTASGLRFGDWQWRLATLPFAFGGLGCTPQTGLSDFVLGQVVVDAAHRKRVKYEASCRLIGYGYILCLNGGAVSWKSSKQSTVAYSTTKSEYLATVEATKEAVWIKKFLTKLDIVISAQEGIELFCDNNGAIAQSKEPRSHCKSKHVERKYHI
ncbi:uncharacterized protein LOC110695831 [Chenopodium quinoa]|uniref:uncharacterized protein LOC110695831 n=1 Tax=Chenopodium quinoa TaxID=63459 RepID=UPI000B77EB8A|nr:uncharacterized protein LOC110695831 [Chenopodium quinoa]